MNNGDFSVTGLGLRLIDMVDGHQESSRHCGLGGIR